MADRKGGTDSKWRKKLFKILLYFIIVLKILFQECDVNYTKVNI